MNWQQYDPIAKHSAATIRELISEAACQVARLVGTEQHPVVHKLCEAMVALDNDKQVKRGIEDRQRAIDAWGSK